MADTPVLNFYLPNWRQHEITREATLFGTIAQAFSAADWRLILRDENEPVSGVGYHLVYNRPVTHPLCLSLRRCYLGPFFRIEATNDRWDWPVAHIDYIAGQGGDWFRKYWAEQLFKGYEITKKGYIFMPLQGRLLIHRHFQSMSPMAMIQAAIQVDPDRQIFASLHPRESYSADELAALRAIKGNFSLVDRPSMELLAGCDYLVTQNSSMALIGMFAQKPPVLFADIDFHHIAASVPKHGIKDAYENLQKPKLWGHYLHWFFREQALSLRATDVVSQIQTRCRAHGWPI